MKSESCSPVGHKLCSICSHENIIISASSFGSELIIFTNLSKIIKITHSLFLHCRTHTHTLSLASADQYMASMDAWCNISSLLSAVLLCSNSSSLLFSMHYTRSLCLSVNAPRFLVLRHFSAISSHQRSCLFFVSHCLHLFYPCLICFAFPVSITLPFRLSVPDSVWRKRTAQHGGAMMERLLG